MSTIGNIVRLVALQGAVSWPWTLQPAFATPSLAGHCPIRGKRQRRTRTGRGGRVPATETAWDRERGSQVLAAGSRLRQPLFRCTYVTPLW